MKIFLAILLMALTITATVDQKPKEFEVTFKVTYNSITLERAAELEKIFKDRFSDACKVDIEIKEVNNWMYMNTDTLYGSTIRWSYKNGL